MLEAVLLTSTSAYIGVLVKDNRRSAKLLEHLKENIDRPISAILSLNTISHTLGSATIAFQVQQQFGEQTATVVSFLLTFSILFVAEIIPKSIGASHWKALIPATAYTIQFMIILLYPLVIIAEWLGQLFSKSEEDPEVSREEILMTAQIGEEEGILKTKESAIIKNLLMLDKIYVSDIMTPRSVFFALESDMTVEDVFTKYKPIRFSRIPVYHESLDNIIGMTYRFKIHEALSNDQHDKKIGEIVTPITSIPERMTVSHVLDYFIKEKEHLALAIDEYGIVAGLVSLEDAVETLLGVEIVDELDSVEDMRKFALEQWQIRKQKMRKS
jgi:CBS domain containing-hemolysin-like protein